MSPLDENMLIIDGTAPNPTPLALGARTRLPWRFGAGVHTLVMAATLMVLGAGCQNRGQPAPTRSAESVARPAPPAPGFPASGSRLDDGMLTHFLPPPPRDALAYDIRDPLRNGPSVPVKKRWLWLPAGTRMQAATGQDGLLSLRVPDGAKLWKEFYLGTPSGERLVERRILRKVADRDENNGWLQNGGWLLYAAHHLPARADGVSGFDTDVREAWGSTAAEAFFFRPEAWLPTQQKGAMTALTLTVEGSKAIPYVFPGKTNCAVCHEGAPGAYASDDPRRAVLAFGAHPENITAASLKALIDRGWLTAPEPLMAHLRTLAEGLAAPPAPSAPEADSTPTMLGLLRNNCLSCHNSVAGAQGRDTAFVLTPGRPYTDAEILALFAKPSRIMGTLGHPVLVPAEPRRSEFILRLLGEEGRRRMPPTEGGVPEPDQELTQMALAWAGRLAQPR